MLDTSIDILTRFAAKARLPEKLVLSAATETVERFMTTWSEEREHLPLSRHIIETIEQHLRKIELVREIARA